MMTGSSRITNLLFAFGLVLVASMTLTGCRKYPKCRTDEHCARYDERQERRGRELYNTPFCVDRTCSECRDDSACAVGESCERGTCRAIPGYCDENILCTPPQVCRDNRCGPQCLSDADCEGEFGYCQNGQCMTGECNDDSDCEAGFRCEGHMCRAIPEAQAPCYDDNFKTVLFDFDEYSIRNDQRDEAEWNLACLGRQDRNITIEGHCDERGTEEYNMVLGERRAKELREFFEDNSIPRSRINVVSYGETRPADPRSSESAWSQNRRAVTTWR